jgi:phospholipid/cholesterol/gamma-HCH transport system permease protein
MTKYSSARVPQCIREKMTEQSQIDFSRPSTNTLQVEISDSWKIGSRTPSAGEVLLQLEADSEINHIIVNARQVSEWDSALLTFLLSVNRESQNRNVEFECQGLAEGAQRLLDIAFAVPIKKDARPPETHKSFFHMVGDSAVHFANSTIEMLSFIGETALTFVKFLGGEARFRSSDLLYLIEDCGARSLSIVTLISVLVGLILAFVGAVQLQLFGAQIYVANLVGISMVREMGALMTAIIMAGRTGAAYAAQLGTMQVNEEIDALTTLGIPPMEFLVLPRVLALLLMMPLLVLYADFMGIMGGAIVGVGMLDISLVQYFKQTQASIDMTNLSLGIFKGAVFAILVAMSGCLRGMQCGRSASAVGEAATSAVVTAIVAIIVTDGLFAVLCNVLRI